MAAALDHLSDRLRAGARSDLLALAKIAFVKSRTAYGFPVGMSPTVVYGGLTNAARRIFWDNGLKTVAAVANADPKELLPVLLQAQPNKARLAAKDEHKYEEKLLAKARIITDSANRLWRRCPSPKMVGRLALGWLTGRRNRNAARDRGGMKLRAIDRLLRMPVPPLVRCGTTLPKEVCTPHGG